MSTYVHIETKHGLRYTIKVKGSSEKKEYRKVLEALVNGERVIFDTLYPEGEALEMYHYLVNRCYAIVDRCNGYLTVEAEHYYTAPRSGSFSRIIYFDELKKSERDDFEGMEGCAFFRYKGRALCLGHFERLHRPIKTLEGDTFHGLGMTSDTLSLVVRISECGEGVYCRKISLVNVKE